MQGPIKYFICFFGIFSSLQAMPTETMKNLEIKLQLDQERFNNLAAQLAPYYSETLYQTDTYFETKHDRFKLREENGKTPYLIRYQRPDLEEAKQSNYLFYPVNNVDLFLSVIGDSLKEELKIKKQRAIYFPKPHIRVHLDQIEDLGNFLEIEIILSNTAPLSVAKTEMLELENWLNITNLSKISLGYRELLQQSKSTY